MKPMISIVLIIALIYFLICTALYFFQDKLIFFPPNAEESTYNQVKKNEISFLTDKEKIVGWNINNDSGISKTVIYFGGNAEDVVYFNEESKRYNVKQSIAFNYPGYGKSTGVPSQKSLYKNALDNYDWALKEYNLKPQNIIIVGRSLGSSVATYLAAHRAIAGLILITPFDSIKNIAKRNYKYFPVSLLMKHPFSTVQYISQVSVPILMLAAEKDEIIATENLKKLMKHTANNTNLIVYKNLGHNTIQNHINYYVDINQFINSLNELN